MHKHVKKFKLESLHCHKIIIENHYFKIYTLYFKKYKRMKNKTLGNTFHGINKLILTLSTTVFE